jgi:hypothetical protein
MLFDSFEFVGYSVQVLPDQSILEAALVWQAHQPANEDYLTEVRLVDEQGQIVSSSIGHAADGFYPTRAWDGGEVINERVKLPIHNLDPGSYVLEGYLLEAYQRPLHAATGPLFSVPITLENISGRRPGLQHLPIETAGEILWVGYQLWPFNFLDFGRPEYHYRSTIRLAWEADLRSQSGQKVNLKLVGPNGRVFEPLADQGNLRAFVVEADWPAGDYRLKVELEQDDKIIGENLSSPLLWVNNRQRQFTTPPMTHRIDANFYDLVKLLGYDLPTSRVKQGEQLSVFVHWQDLQIVNVNLLMFNHLYDMNGNQWASFDHIPPPYYGGTITWVPGEFVSDGFTIPIAPDVPDGIYTVHVGLFLGIGENAWVPLPLINEGQVTDTTYVTLGPIQIGSPPAEVLALDPNPRYPRNDNLGNLVRLRGYDLTVSPDTQEIELTLYWESLSTTEKNLTTFAHLQDENGRIIAQKDGPPAGGAYPTSLWDVNEIIKDEIVLTLPGDFSADKFELVVGMYDWSTGERLTISKTSQNAIQLVAHNTGEIVQ